MPKKWTPDELMGLTRAFQGACVITAAAELDIFTVLAKRPLTAAAVAKKTRADLRATTMLLDALAAMQLLVKKRTTYAPAPGTTALLTPDAPDSQLAMVRHSANCMRSWVQLASVVKSGKKATRPPSVRGAAADTDSFIEAMNNVCHRMAGPLINELPLPPFTHLLDVGGGPATWTIAFLKKNRKATATLFDLPNVVPIARRHIKAAGMAKRVKLAPGSFLKDPLPAGADLAWVSAIIHMNSRAQNRTLFRKVFRALQPGGSILIRNIVMAEDRITPPGGAMFAINMLVNTPGGGTFTLTEIREDLQAAGFVRTKLLHEDPFMNSVVAAVKPEE